MFVGRIGDESKKECVPVQIRETLEWIQKKMEFALDLTISSERMINFLVADSLDLGLLRTNNFRQSNRVFKICEPLDEVLNILRGKVA